MRLLRKKFILIFIVGIEVCVIVLFFIRGNALDNKTTVVPVSNQVLNTEARDELRYFYEPSANTTGESPDWITPKGVNTFNADTLHERYDYSPKKEDGVFRIVTLGNSFTFGLYVNTQDNFSEQLEDLLNKKNICRNISSFEVINLGVQGYDIRYAVERYKTRGKKYNPDLMIWYVMFTDFEKISDEYQKYFEKIYNNYPPEERNSGGRQLYVKAAEEAEEEMRRANPNEKILEYQKNALYSIRDYYSNPLVVFSSMGFLHEYESVVAEFAKEKNIYFNGNIGKLGDKNYWVDPNDSHPNLEGHTLITQDLYAYLYEAGVIPCEN